MVGYPSDSLAFVLVCTRKPWLAATSHPKPSIVLSHGLSRLASRKDCKPAVRDSKPWLWSLPRIMNSDLLAFSCKPFCRHQVQTAVVQHNSRCEINEEILIDVDINEYKNFYIPEATKL